MKIDTITKLYAGLTDNERAALAFDYLMQGSDIERKRIESAMPEQYFVGMSLEYRRTYAGYLDISMQYAIEYWKNAAMAQMFLAGHHAVFDALMEKYPTNTERVQSPEWQKSEAILKRFENYEIMLLSLEVAIDELCADRGINPAAMRKMAGERHYQVIGTPPDKPDLEPNAAIVAEFRKMWSTNLE